MQRLRTPLVLSSGPIEQLTEARTSVKVRIGGREATGHSSMYLSDLWAWPDPAMSHAQRDALLRRTCESIANDLDVLCGGEPAHPLELGLRLHHQVCRRHAEDAGAPPPLALSMCLSPFDAAIHDAVGQVLNRSAFAFYEKDVPLPSADPWFEGQTAAVAIRGMLRPKPRRTLDAWLIVGKGDDLDRDMAPWMYQRGYRCFKLKLTGQDNSADVDRTVQVYRAARRFGIDVPRLSVDSNEANPDAASVLDYLDRLQALDDEAYAALTFLEQPTGRDITQHAHDWRKVTARKPVLLDEGLTDLELLPIAASQGWSGLALKTCKGHSFALTAAAWAHQRGLCLSMQDLTNPGYAAIHAALMAAHLPTINGVELNSPQFTPDANAPWLPRLSSLFEPTAGVHQLPDASSPGLGSGL